MLDLLLWELSFESHNGMTDMLGVKRLLNTFKRLRIFTFGLSKYIKINYLSGEANYLLSSSYLICVIPPY